MEFREYHKIQTVFLRDPATKHKTLLEGEFALPEFSYLADSKWIFTEKVDGTNVRVALGAGQPLFGGRTDAAQMPTALLARLQEIFSGQPYKFPDIFPGGIVLYGEGHGAGIQKGGGNYSPAQDFVLFDVFAGGRWRRPAEVEDIATAYGIKAVPCIGSGGLPAMVEMARSGFQSAWGDFLAEGIVARPATELFGAHGDRVITKIKCRDFRDAARK